MVPTPDARLGLNASITAASGNCTAVAILISGTMRGFIDTVGSLQAGILRVNAQVGVAFHLATYSDRDCQDIGLCGDKKMHCPARAVTKLSASGDLITPGVLRAAYAAHDIALQDACVEDFNASVVNLPRQPLMHMWHGNLERISSQYLLRARVFHLATSKCRPDVAMLLRPDLNLTSTWSFKPNSCSTCTGGQKDWKLSIAFAGGACVHTLVNNSIVVPRANEAGTACQDYLAAGTTAAVSVYMDLHHHIVRGTYSHLGSIVKPEQLLMHHMRASGLDVQLACGAESSSTWSAGNPPPKARVAPSKYLQPSPGLSRDRTVTGTGHLFKRIATCRSPL
mmetsp:Transcript_63985/g.142943  ORF Transcript_63985/g.142943 Transcript_63985/m.142943 type:complete len:338 (-) Transcript_63985:129-1142(-)